MTETKTPGRTVPPSGEQYTIRSGTWQATIVEESGGLRTLSHEGFEILDGYSSEEMCHDARGQLLLPWPNRIARGKYAFRGTEYQVPINEVNLGNAIHGLSRWKRWERRGGTESALTMGCTLFAEPGYPFVLDLEATYELTGDELRVTLRGTNVGDAACPFGAGQHPYFLPGTRLVDDAELRVPAHSMYRADEQLIPVEKVPVEGTEFDFRRARQIGSLHINTGFTDLDRDAAGRAHVTIMAPGSGNSIDVWMDEAFKHVMVYTGDTVQPPERRRRSVAVEPMSCPANAFNSGTDLIVLEPGEQWEGHWGVRAQ